MKNCWGSFVQNYVCSTIIYYVKLGILLILQRISMKIFICSFALGIQDTLPDDLSDEDDDGFIDFDNLATNNLE